MTLPSGDPKNMTIISKLQPSTWRFITTFYHAMTKLLVLKHPPVWELLLRNKKFDSRRQWLPPDEQVTSRHHS